MRKNGKRKNGAKVSGASWAKLHRAYLELGDELNDLVENLNDRVVKKLADKHGVPRHDASVRAIEENWELERQGLRAKRWWSKFGEGAKTEEEFVARFSEHTYGHLTVRGPEGRALAKAMARDTWRRAMVGALQLDAERELERAKRNFDAIEDQRKKLGLKTWPLGDGSRDVG